MLYITFTDGKKLIIKNKNKKRLKKIIRFDIIIYYVNTRRLVRKIYDVTTRSWGFEKKVLTFWIDNIYTRISIVIIIIVY